MIEKIIKARKDYECVYCGKKIRKGTLHQFGKTRVPRYKDDDIFCDDIQIGIEYVEWRLCLRNDPLCVEVESRGLK